MGGFYSQNPLPIFQSPESEKKSQACYASFMITKKKSIVHEKIVDIKIKR